MSLTSEELRFLAEIRSRGKIKTQVRAKGEELFNRWKEWGGHPGEFKSAKLNQEDITVTYELSDYSCGSWTEEVTFSFDDIARTEE